MFTTLIMVIVSQVYAYIQIHQIVYIKCAGTSIKLFKNTRKKSLGKKVFGKKKVFGIAKS